MTTAAYDLHDVVALGAREPALDPLGVARTPARAGSRSGSQRPSGRADLPARAGVADVPRAAAARRGRRRRTGRGRGRGSSRPSGRRTSLPATYSSPSSAATRVSSLGRGLAVSARKTRLSRQAPTKAKAGGATRARPQTSTADGHLLQGRSDGRRRQGGRPSGSRTRSRPGTRRRRAGRRPTTHADEDRAEGRPDGPGRGDDLHEAQSRARGPRVGMTTSGQDRPAVRPIPPLADHTGLHRVGAGRTAPCDDPPPRPAAGWDTRTIATASAATKVASARALLPGAEAIIAC